MKIAGCELSDQLARIVEEHAEHFRRKSGESCYIFHTIPVSAAMKVVLDNLVLELEKYESSKHRTARPIL